VSIRALSGPGPSRTIGEEHFIGCERENLNADAWAYIFIFIRPEDRCDPGADRFLTDC
jgi:hypothetical protein